MTEQERIRNFLREQVQPEIRRLNDTSTSFPVRRDQELEKLETLRQSLLKRYEELNER
jgi:hypothetical protein